MSVGMVIIYIFILSANSLLITLFLDTVHDLRPLQSGLPLLLVALLQLLATPFCAFLVLKADTRLLCATGVLLMGLACYQGTFITADWVAADFFPMAILFAIGHPLVFLSLMAFCMACFTAKTAVGLLAYIQVSRISTPIAGNALFLLLIRQRVDLYFSQTGSRLTGDAPAVARFLDSGGCTRRSTSPARWTSSGNSCRPMPSSWGSTMSLPSASASLWAPCCCWPSSRP